MSEDDRSRLYAWVRECTDEPLAEYFMSCLAPSPLSDLVTKDFLTAELSRFATKEEMQAGFDKLWAAITKLSEQREADRAAAIAQREADRAEAVAQREADRDAILAETRRQHRWVIGTMIATATLLVGVMAVVAAVLSSSAA